MAFTSISPSLLSDLLSVPKVSILAKINKGVFALDPQTHHIDLAQINHLPQVQAMLGSNWDAEHRIEPKRPYRMVELFAGAGGLALGMAQAGFESVLLNDIDKHACQTLRLNRPDWNVVEEDITTLDFRAQVRESVDLLTGGFPCQAFSYAGKSLGFEDTRGTLFFEMARAIRSLQPKVVLAENVRALLTHDHGKTFKTICDVIDELGYVLLGHKVLKALFYKVPQKRERLILVAVRKDMVCPGLQFIWPSPYKRLLTLRDAFFKGELFESDVPPSRGVIYPKRKKEIMALVPEGGYWRDLPDDLQREYMGGSYFLTGGKTGLARRLSMDEPSLTLTCSPAQKQTERCHPTETRPLQVREYARVQTFPDTWQFAGSLTAQYKQIGNAVPVNLAKALGHALVRLLNTIEASR